MPLFVSMGVVRMAVFALRQAFRLRSWLAAEKVLALVVWCSRCTSSAGCRVDRRDGAVKFSIGTQQLSRGWILGALTVLLTLLFALWFLRPIEQRLLRQLRSTELQLVFRGSQGRADPRRGVDRVVLVGIGIHPCRSSAGRWASARVRHAEDRRQLRFGFIILLDRLISIGNMVSVETDRGVVSQITTRYTVPQAQWAGGAGAERNPELVVQNETSPIPAILLPDRYPGELRRDLERASGDHGRGSARVPRVPRIRLRKPTYLGQFADSGINLRVGLWPGDPREGLLGVSGHQPAVWRRFREGIDRSRSARSGSLPPPALHWSWMASGP